jgi:transcriptional regulator with XRE-family HTH domain
MEGSLAQRLRILRARKGLTLTQAGEQMGITRHTLAALERGGQEPHFDTLHKIARVYGVPVEELLEEPVPFDEASDAGLPEDLDELMQRARELKAEWTRLMDHERITSRPGEYERVRPRLNEIERDLGKLRRRAQELDAPRYILMHWPNRPAHVVFFEEPTSEERAELEAQHGEYEEEHVFELAGTA